VRFGDEINTIWPEIFHPARMDPGADLVLLHPDGSEEILVDCDTCGVTDPFVSFDAIWVYYSLFHDLTQLNTQRGNLPTLGADIFRINLNSREIQQLTHGKFTPNTGNGNWDESNPLNPSSEYNRLGYGILNLGPMPLPGNKLVFTSNRNGFVPTKGFTNPTLQLYVMDVDGSNVEAIAPMTIGSALHPTILNDGRIMFSSYESQGLRDRRMWGIWTIHADGTNWAPLVSALTSPNAFHFNTQISSGDIIIEQYYNLNNNGFGALYGLPATPPDGMPPFQSPFPNLNTPIDYTSGSITTPFTFSFPFQPQGYYAVTPMTHPQDHAAPLDFDEVTRVGKFTHPSAAPENDLLVVWTPGPANDLNRPTTMPFYDAGLYVIDNSDPVWHPNELILIKNDPAYNEAWPRAVVPWSAIHGQAQPTKIARLSNDGTLHPQLQQGTPYGLVGSSSLYKRDTFPGKGDSSFDGLDPFNTSENGSSSNWDFQGADAGKYNNSDIWALRVLAMEPITDRRYGPNSSPSGNAGDFISHANEKLRILGEIPVRKFDINDDPIMDVEGNPDTSFLVKIPADTPFTFQTLDRNGMTLNMSQTWHQVKAGELRADCGGCHAHSQIGLDFNTTMAASVDYPVINLNDSTPLITRDDLGANDVQDVAAAVVDIEFYQDIRPILQSNCINCHNNSQQAGQLILDDVSVTNNIPNDYKRLADDSSAQFGYSPVINNGTWRQTNASRYIRKFQSRRSLLTWKVFGERLDGWSNDDHPTETVAGDASTLPNGVNPNDADLDFIASVDHPAGGMNSLTMKQKMTLARWIDLGAPLDISVTTGHPGMGWFMDDLRPTVTVSSPVENMNSLAINVIRIGIADANTGLDMTSFSIKADFEVNSLTPESELVGLATMTHQGIYEIQLDAAIPQDNIERHLKVEVKDNQGNVKRVDVRFYTSDLIFEDGFE
jgi:hypothetical protein